MGHWKGQISCGLISHWKTESQQKGSLLIDMRRRHWEYRHASRVDFGKTVKIAQIVVIDAIVTFSQFLHPQEVRTLESRKAPPKFLTA